jgi:glycosyltransferase involved in cell wall biosynthesis
MFGSDDITTLIGKWGVLFKPLKKYFLSKMDVYIAQSPAMTQSFKKEFGNRIPYLETAQGVDTRKFMPMKISDKINIRKKLDLPDDCTIVISVGYVIERKGLREVFESLEKQKNKNFLYIVIGDYELLPEHYLYDSRDEMNALYHYGLKLLGTNVQFTGSIENTDEYFQAADIFILNSKKEGMPNVLLEAMASGLPSIVRRLPGVDKYVTYHNENSLVIDSEEELDYAISTLFDTPARGLVLGTNAHRFINKQFSLENVAKKIAQKCV